MSRAALHWGLALLLIATFLHWATGLDGQVEFHLGEHWVHMTVSALMMVAGALFVLFHLLLRAWSWAAAAPDRHKLRVELDNRLLGEAAQAKALLAVLDGRGAEARQDLARARRLLGETPAVLVLEAEAARAAGDTNALAAARRALASHPEARLVGVAEDHRAVAAPAGPEDAPRLLEAAQAAGDPETAAALERRALAADPGFAPAALAVAARLAAAGQAERARGVLATAWTRWPAAALGEALLAGPGSAAEHLRFVDDLTRSTVNAPASRALRAAAALKAGETGRARYELDAWAGSEPTDRRWFELMEALERAEQGDAFPEDRAWHWRNQAAAAPAPA
jgi:HemY protein